MTVQPVPLQAIKNRAGVYILGLKVPYTTTLRIGRLGTYRFEYGEYLYIGSARGPGGIHARVMRHLHQPPDKRTHWHVDWIRQIASPIGVLCAYSHEGVECSWATLLEKLGRRFPKGFGASDCRCRGHLLRLDPGVGVDDAQTLLNAENPTRVHKHLVENRLGPCETKSERVLP